MKEITIQFKTANEPEGSSSAQGTTMNSVSVWTIGMNSAEDFEVLKGIVSDTQAIFFDKIKSGSPDHEPA